MNRRTIRTIRTMAVCLLAAGSVMAQGQTKAKGGKVIAQALNTDYLAFEAETGSVQTELDSPNRWLPLVDEDASGGGAMQGNVTDGKRVHAAQSLLVFRLKFNKAGTYTLRHKRRKTRGAIAR